MLDQTEVQSRIDTLSKTLKNHGAPVPSLTGVDLIQDLEALESAATCIGINPFISQAEDRKNILTKSVADRLCSITDPKQRTEFYRKHRAQIIMENHNRLLGK